MFSHASSFEISDIRTTPVYAIQGHSLPCRCVKMKITLVTNALVHQRLWSQTLAVLRTPSVSLANTPSLVRYKRAQTPHHRPRPLQVQHGDARLRDATLHAAKSSSWSNQQLVDRTACMFGTFPATLPIKARLYTSEIQTTSHQAGNLQQHARRGPQSQAGLTCRS